MAHVTHDDGSIVTEPEGAARAYRLRRRFADFRRDVAWASATAEYDDYLDALLTMTVPDFCQWCAIDIVNEVGVLRRLALRDEEGSHDEHGQRADELSSLMTVDDDVHQRVLMSGRSEMIDLADSSWSHGFVVGLHVNDRPFGTVSFARNDADFDSHDLAAAEEVSWATAALIDRVILHHNTRDAIRRTQKIASQLHQLIAASITVAGLQREQEILVRLAGSTRSVFDADVAFVSLESGSVAPLWGVATRGRAAAAISSEDDTAELPRSRPGLTAPWRQDQWLVAPILEERNLVRGVIALRREHEGDLGPEDQEVLTLLAQMASRSLGAVELSRSIQRSEARWRVLVETAPVGIIEVDVHGDVRWWNRAASKIFAWPEHAEVVAQSVELPAGALDGLRELWSSALDGAAPGGRDLVDIEIHGRRRYLSASAVPLPSSDGEAPVLLTLIDDVTDHREMKAEIRLAHQMEIRGQVASSVAHDFNNLLTLISGYTEMLLQDLTDDGARETVKDIQSIASRASLLTSQLQTIGRTQAAEAVVVSPVATIQSNAEVIERIVGVNIELRWSLGLDVGNIRVDADQFEQMILNLTINARDAMPAGGTLSIAADGTSLDAEDAGALDVSAGDYVRISIADNGIGMDEATRLHCFDPLFTTKGPFRGTGMGLAAARRLVEESGGAIECLSALGQGTTFVIYLPVVRDQPASASPINSNARPQGSATVLIVEDDAGLRHLMVQVLERNGYEVLEASSGEEAIETASTFQHTIDILVSDVVLGGLEGPELAATLQSRLPELRVLMVSGTADATVIRELTPGSALFLAKPFKPSALIDHVHRLHAAQRA